MFGLLLGTLEKFKKESNVSTEKVSKTFVSLFNLHDKIHFV